VAVVVGQAEVHWAHLVQAVRAALVVLALVLELGLVPVLVQHKRVRKLTRPAAASGKHQR